MHTGRVTHVANLPAGAEVLGPDSAPCPGDMYTDSQGMQPHSAPRAMTDSDIARVVGEYAQSAQLAIEAGFDGIELHAANGYLIEQFLNANVNRRSDAYGGSIEGRNRFALEVARAAADAIGADRVGIRLSPHGVFNDTRTRTRNSSRSPADCRHWACCTCMCWTTLRWALRPCPRR
jgi:N-ethylmaleimide reductase